ncbi:MAG TPA: anthranilate phosphoribosyltransferase [Candidatus Xenobia bacterium]|nr:anthranilate phosphoribosyltransferase [Candidatus Xenobia bacterium]
MAANERKQGNDFRERVARVPREALTRAEAREVMEVILRGEATDEQIASLLLALQQRGETVEELVGFAEAMRAHARPVFGNVPRPAAPLLDTCGTGGDGAGTFNVSTAAAFVAAAAGARVAKHGNRSLSSRCGSADVLEALGVNLLAEPDTVASAIAEIGIGFVFAPAFHTAMKHAQKARRELKVRTVFNLLGPLTNPARVEAQVTGVYEERWLEPVAATLCELGVERAFVLHSHDGLDEASLSDITDVVEINSNGLRRFEISPEDFGLSRAPRESLAGGDAETNASILKRVLAGERSAYRDAVLMNTSLALVAAGCADGFCQGVALAAEAIGSGKAGKCLRDLVAFTNRHQTPIP